MSATCAAPSARRYALLLAAYTGGPALQADGGDAAVCVAAAGRLAAAGSALRRGGSLRRFGCEPREPRPSLLHCSCSRSCRCWSWRGIVSVITVIAPASRRGGGRLHRSSFADRVANALVSYVAYLGQDALALGTGARSIPSWRHCRCGRSSARALFLVAVTALGPAGDGGAIRICSSDGCGIWERWYRS